MNDAKISHMVDRFLTWPLPNDFQPDAGISFEPEFNKEWNAERGLPADTHRPQGTNLLTHSQAEEMVRYLLQGLPE